MGEDPGLTKAVSGRPLLLAWAVHAFTASGIVLGWMALLAAIGGRSREALLWLLAALLIDAVDGSLARWAKVKERVPRIDGDALDLVIDYVSYVVIPALIIWQLDILPGGLALPLTGAILLSSLYVFARKDMKTADGYFRGFPALWNVVALYFVLIPMQPALAAGIVLILVCLTFAPVHFIHPFRSRDFRPWAAVISILWAATTALSLLLPPELEPAIRSALLGVSVTSAAIVMALGFLRSVRGPR
jgi:phosphatidylcholine synthase